MKLLLDTHIVQWLALNINQLNRNEQEVIRSDRNQLHISAVSLLEMRVKWQTAYRSGARKGEADPDQVLAALALIGVIYDELPLTFAHCTAVLRDDFDHRDPFDCLLLAQAQVEGLRLLTRDGKFEGHPLALIA